MLPDSGDILKQDFEIVDRPSKTYRFQAEQITGYADGLEAVKQAALCILNTERYDWLIYSWNYGVELKGLFGKPMGLVKSKLKKRIKEALMQDDRIQSVDAFLLRPGRKLAVSFTIHTKFGDIEVAKEVKV
ncbi:hypothetical protein CRH03_25395 [Clostridium sp. HMb25]|nr:hypothetical protein CRH03_25395 [Clostridium sp. HMb25]